MFAVGKLLDADLRISDTKPHTTFGAVTTANMTVANKFSLYYNDALTLRYLQVDKILIFSD